MGYIYDYVFDTISSVINYQENSYRMADVAIITHLLVIGVISIALNSIFVFITGALLLLVGIQYAELSKYPFYTFFTVSQAVPITFSTLYFTTLLFQMVYGVVAIIGVTFGMLLGVGKRKVGLVLLIVMNSILFIFLLMNIGGFISQFTLHKDYGYPTGLIASWCVAISVCQCVLLGYGIFHIIMISLSFRRKNVGQTSNQQTDLTNKQSNRSTTVT